MVSGSLLLAAIKTGAQPFPLIAFKRLLTIRLERSVDSLHRPLASLPAGGRDHRDRRAHNE